LKLSASLIETERLLIRTYESGDARALFEMVSADKESLKDYFPLTVEANASIAGSRRFIRERRREQKEGKSVFYGIFEKKTGRLTGQIAVRDINWRVPKCELGYFIVSGSRGKGFAPEALNGIAKFCFENAKMAKLLLRIENINEASKNVARKCGFSLSGTLRNDFRSASGRLMDCEVWERISAL
jgi:RimJ/RimL family protein N-acetyltransferase